MFAVVADLLNREENDSRLTVCYSIPPLRLPEKRKKISFEKERDERV
jgi:hypothetical protein